MDHVTLYRWVQRFTPLVLDAARPCRHAVGGRTIGSSAITGDSKQDYGRSAD